MSKVTINYDNICYFRSTEKAWCFYWGCRNNSEKTAFLPKSLVTVDEAVKTITLPEWLMIEKGLDGYVTDQ